MNYILEINAFERRMKRQPLPTMAQLLWYKLMAFANRQHWPESFSIGNDQLQGMLNTGSDQTARNARKQLVDAGLLLYEQGKKGSPGKHKLISIAANEFPEACQEYYGEKPGRVEDYLEDDITRYFGYTEAIGLEVRKITEELFDTFRPGAQPTTRDELEVFHKVIHREGEGREGTVLTIPEENKALLVHAFEQAAMAGAVNWNYINGIYRNFNARGITTVEQAYDYEVERDYRKGRL